MNASSTDETNYWREELRQALEDPVLTDPAPPVHDVAEVQRASLRVATALGSCRLQGVAVPAEHNGVLPVSVAIAAARGLERWMGTLLEEARRLGDLADHVESPALEARLEDLLQARLLAWGALLALGEAAWEHRSTALNKAIEFSQLSIEQVDAALTIPENLIIFSVLVETSYLERARQSLAAEFREVLPWWLDGTLEGTQQELAKWSERVAVQNQSPVQPAPPIVVSTKQVASSHSMARIVPTDRPGALAADARTQGRELFEALTWQSPDKVFEAILVFPQQRHAKVTITLSFHRSKKPAVELAGVTCWLAGQAGQIDEKASVRFLLRDVYREGEGLTLAVGDANLLWIASTT